MKGERSEMARHRAKVLGREGEGDGRERHRANVVRGRKARLDPREIGESQARLINPIPIWG